jgi:hypothetical protein
MKLYDVRVYHDRGTTLPGTARRLFVLGTRASIENSDQRPNEAITPTSAGLWQH